MNETGQWMVLQGKKALRLATQNNVVRDDGLNDAAVLVHSPPPNPGTVHVHGSISCHVCAGTIPLDRQFFTGGLSSARIDCPGCQHQVDAMSTSVDGMTFLVVSPGTQPSRGSVKRIVLHLETVDGQKPVPLEVPVSAERIERLLNIVRDNNAGPVEIEELAEVGESVMPTLLDLLANGPGKSCASHALIAMGSAAIPGLVGLLCGELDEPRSAAAQALCGIKPEGVVALRQALSDSRPLVRNSAVFYLRYLDKPDQSVVSAIIRCLDDPDDDVRNTAISSLAKHGALAKEAVPRLVELLEEGNAYVADALVTIGPNAVCAVPALLKAVEQQVPNAHGALTRANLLGPAALPAAVTGLRHSSPSVRHAATCAVQSLLKAKVSQIPDDLIPTLIHCLKDESDSVRSLAARSLQHLGPRASAARSALKAGLNDPDKWTADFMRDALAAVGSDEESTSNAKASPGILQTILRWCGKRDER